MTHIRQQYLRFISWPDTQFAPYPVPNRDISTVKMPDRYSYAFYFFERIEEIVVVDGEEVKLFSAERNESPIHYYGAKIYTPTEYESEFHDKKTIDQIKKNGWVKFMVVRSGELMPVDETGIIVHSQ